MKHPPTPSPKKKPTLKPCPFCGSEAEVVYLTSMPGLQYIICSGANCGVLPYTYRGTAKATIAAWNTRAAPTPGGRKDR